MFGTVPFFLFCPAESGLLANVGQDTTVHIEHVAVYGIRSMRSQEHSGATQL